MREIKFRAWDKLTTKMYGVEFINFADFRDKEGSTILMQYTGLKDKNGKEIYEGDIVTSLDWDGKFLCQYDSKFACFEFYDDQTDTFLGGASYGDKVPLLEVIGNVYEHPELLNQ